MTKWLGQGRTDSKWRCQYIWSSKVWVLEQFRKWDEDSPWIWKWYHKKKSHALPQTSPETSVLGWVSHAIFSILLFSLHITLCVCKSRWHFIFSVSNESYQTSIKQYIQRQNVKKWGVFTAFNISKGQHSCILLFVLLMLNFVWEKFCYIYRKFKNLLFFPKNFLWAKALI